MDELMNQQDEFPAPNLTAEELRKYQAEERRKYKEEMDSRIYAWPDPVVWNWNCRECNQLNVETVELPNTSECTRCNTKHHLEIER